MTDAREDRVFTYDDGYEDGCNQVVDEAEPVIEAARAILDALPLKEQRAGAWGVLRSAIDRWDEEHA